MVCRFIENKGGRCEWILKEQEKNVEEIWHQKVYMEEQ